MTLDYPNTVDRFHRRTGSGIWIHGTAPDFLSRPPKASDGCLTLDNDDFKIISNLVKGSVSVPVIIDHSPRWVSETERLKQKSALWKSFSDWFATEAALNFPNLTSVLTQNNGSVKLDSKQIDAFEIFHNLNVIPELTKTQILKYPGETNTYITEMSLKPEASDSFTIRQFWRYNDLNQWSLINLFDQ